MTTLVSRALGAARSRRRTVSRLLGLLWVILAASPAFAESLGMVTPDRWVPNAKVGILDRVALKVHWYDSIQALRQAAIAQNVSAIDLHGFSVLHGNPKTGEYVCDVHVVRMRGALVDNDRTVTFGHEVLHCFGFRHE